MCPRTPTTPTEYSSGWLLLPSRTAISEIESFYSPHQRALSGSAFSSAILRNACEPYPTWRFKADIFDKEFNLKTTIASVFAALFFITTAMAQAPGQPETLLAGIDIHHTKIADVIKLYGEPEGVYAAPAPYPSGTKQYKWGRLTLTLKILTEPTANGDAITAIQIDGDGDSRPISRTGRGLKLGDKPQSIKKIYGIELQGTSTTLRWPDGEMLLIRLDDKSRVDRLELSLKK
jgi:hypothetical protein